MLNNHIIKELCAHKSKLTLFSLLALNSSAFAMQELRRRDAKPYTKLESEQQELLEEPGQFAGAGGNTNDDLEDQNAGCSALWRSIRAKVLLTICPNKYYSDELIEASKNNDIDKVRYLLKSGANPNTRTNNNPLLALAIENDHIEIVKALLDAGANPDRTDPYGRTIFMLAAENGRTEIVQMLLATLEINVNATPPNILNSTAPLMLAAKNGHTETVKALLEKGANVNIADNWLWRYTALMFAVENGHTETVKALLDAGADVNAVNKYRDTALTLAVKNGNTELVKSIVNKNPNADILNEALSWAATKNHGEIMKILKEAGADVNAVLIQDARNGSSEAVKRLFDLGAAIPKDVSYPNHILETFLLIKNLKQKTVATEESQEKGDAAGAGGA